MFESMITTGVMLISIITTFFHHPSNIQVSDQPTILAAIDIVNQPNNKSTKKKNTGSVTRIKKRSVMKPELSKQKNRISGYRNETFVYGEVKPLGDDKVQGFIYHPDNSKTYIYGKKTKNTLNLYDFNGNLYQMIDEEPIRH